MKMLRFKGIVVTILLLGVMAVASDSIAGQITSEDFEGGAVGWSDNTTTIGNSNFTEFLGLRGAQNGSVGKTYALSGTQTQVTISFDFYEIDSWDDEDFWVEVNGSRMIQDSFDFRRIDNPGKATKLLGGNSLTDLGFGSGLYDQTYRYTFSFNYSLTDFSLEFGSTLNQPNDDESFGIDNLVITDNSTPNPVPEPATVALLGIGLAGMTGAGARRRWKKRAVDKS